MENQRQRKFSRLLQKELGEILLQDKRGIIGSNLVSVLEVRISPDLGVAKIYLSLMMVKEKEKIMHDIVERKGEIRNLLGRRIGKQVRIIPELIFIADDVEEKAIRVEEILRNLNIPPEKE